MSNTLGAWEDSGLTSEQLGLYTRHSTAGSEAPVDTIVYIGSPIPGRAFYAASDPGVDEIEISVVDAMAMGAPPATAVSLALTAGGLDTAVPGAPLALGTEILSGAANAVAVHVRVEIGATGIGLYENLSIVSNDTEEQVI